MPFQRRVEDMQLSNWKRPHFEGNLRRLWGDVEAGAWLRAGTLHLRLIVGILMP